MERKARVKRHAAERGKLESGEEEGEEEEEV